MFDQPPRPRASINAQSRDVVMQLDVDALPTQLPFDNTRHSHEDHLLRGDIALPVRSHRTFGANERTFGEASPPPHTPTYGVACSDPSLFIHRLALPHAFVPNAL